MPWALDTLTVLEVLSETLSDTWNDLKIAWDDLYRALDGGVITALGVLYES